MKVEAVSVPAAASDPLHPDHERWVKDQTLKMEIEHAKLVGKSTREAEAENARMLERSAKLATGPAKKKDKPAAIAPNMGHERRATQRGVTVKSAKEISLLKLSPCGRCGTCHNCMRERRVLLIVQKRKEDTLCKSLADSLFIYALRVSGGFGEYGLWSKRDRDRAIAAKAEETCNLSIPKLGEWR